MTDGGAAFPAHWNGMQPPQVGMSLRDWFAGMALHASINAMEVKPPAQWAALYAYEYADAMLAEREKSK